MEHEDSVSAITPEAAAPAAVAAPAAPAWAPEAEAYKRAVAAMTEDERLAATLACLDRRASFRDILYGLLDFCREERSYEEIDAHVSASPDILRNGQEPQRYVHMLLRTGALREIELGEDGEPVTDDDKRAAVEAGMDPEDAELLVFDWHVVTTDVGLRALDEYSPRERMRRLEFAFPDRTDAFARILEFCREPRTMGQLDDAFKGKDFLGVDETSKLKRQPSSYVDKLGAAGALHWDGSAWRITDIGEEFLAAQADAPVA